MYQLITSFPIAIDSPDHIAPWGVSQDNNTSQQLLDELEAFFGSQFSIMDLGCAWGQFIIDALSRGHTAVGLEGSDWPIRHNQANWVSKYNQNLFNCDISRPFYLFSDDQLLQFDCITSWEFLEHISEDRLDIVFENVCRHLAPQGIFIGQYATTPDEAGSKIASSRAGVPYIELHQTIRDKSWWDTKFAQFFDAEPYPFVGGVREEGESIRYFLRKRQ